MKPRDEAIERIKKLLRMKRGGTQGEIDNALAMAQEIARKYGIDLGAVNPDEEEQLRPIAHEDAIAGARMQWENKYAGMICDRFFNVHVFTRRIQGWRFALTFVGDEWNRQIAIYVFRFLSRHFRREWNTNSGRARNRRAFMWGMYVGISSKLSDAQKREAANEAGLVLLGRAVQRRKDYITKYFGDLKSSDAKPKHKADNSFVRGYQAGQDTEILKGVEYKEPERKAIGI